MFKTSLDTCETAKDIETSSLGKQRLYLPHPPMLPIPPLSKFRSTQGKGIGVSVTHTTLEA